MQYTTQQFTDALDEVNTLYDTDYSGRNMFGKTCVSIDAENDADIFELFAKLGAENLELATFAAKRTKVDSMGRGIVVYWPVFQTFEG